MKLTQWHKGSVRPVHVGVYKKSCEECYSYWTGEIWNGVGTSVKRAYEKHISNPDYKSAYSNDDWCGILKGKP